MRFSEDILRGLRLGALLLIGLAVGVAAYRMTRQGPADFPPPAPEPEAQAPAQSFHLPTFGSTFSDPAKGVPPPPPVGGDPRRAVRRKPAATTAPEQPQAAAVPDATADAASDNSPAAEPAAEENAASEAAKEDAGAPDQSSNSDVDDKNPGRGKRFLKAVGRLFHIGNKKDAAGQSMRPPQN
jgi:type IV secretory pathway VirB10-like protein